MEMCWQFHMVGNIIGAKIISHRGQGVQSPKCRNMAYSNWHEQDGKYEGEMNSIFLGNCEQMFTTYRALKTDERNYSTHLVW